MEIIREIEGLALSRIDVDQFYGIELGEFPVRIAETAVWMVDPMMNNRLSLELGEACIRIPSRNRPISSTPTRSRRTGPSSSPSIGARSCSGIPRSPERSTRALASGRRRAIAALGKSGGTLDYSAAAVKPALQIASAALNPRIADRGMTV